MNRKTLVEEMLIEIELDKRLGRKNLTHFTNKMWTAVEPKVHFQHNWHIDAICEHLQAVKENQIKNLIISVPPGHMKSLAVSVFFPAWVWVDNPEKRFIYASYAQPLSTRDSVKCRMLVESPEYKSTFDPKWSLSDDQNQKTRFNNTASGFRIATSTGGTGTGERADFIIVDDPLNAIDAHSELARQSVIDWWDQAMSSRDADPNTSHRIIIMQRLHEKDLAGHCEVDKSYEVLKLPAEFEPEKRKITSIGWTDPRKEKGELLWPERFTLKHQENQKKLLGSRGYSAQQQQDPIPVEGALFKRLWWKYPDAVPQLLEIVQFIDAAQKPGITNDYSVIATWAKTPNGYLIMDVWRDKVETPVLEAKVKAMAEHWKPNAIVIEDKSAGSSLIQYLLRDTTLPVLPFDPGRRDKEVRATAATPTIESGKVFLPKLGRWIEDFIKEHEKFPNGDHDDQVDTTSMAVEYFSRRFSSQPRIRTL